jgi:hypothetical protein
MTPNDIADALGIEFRFVEQRLARARETLGAESNVELAEWAVHLGLNQSDPSEE